MLESSSENNTISNPKLDIRAVFLYNRNVDMKPLNVTKPEKQAQHEWGFSMSHYDQIVVQPIATLRERSFCDSPLAQAYRQISDKSCQKPFTEQPQQSILAFADISENLTLETINSFWDNHDQPVFFITLINLNKKASLSDAQVRIQQIFDLDTDHKTLVYYTFDYNDIVIFHKGASLSEYVHSIMKLDYTSIKSSSSEHFPLVSDSITLYSFSENFRGQLPADETFYAYLRMGIANTKMMSCFQRKLETLPKHGELLEVNYILGRHDIGFYQRKATLRWVYDICALMQEISKELEQEQQEKGKQNILPIWYTTSTLSIRIPPKRRLPDIGTIVWDGTHQARGLHIRLDEAYKNFVETYKATCCVFSIMEDGTWLNWLKKGYQQALSFLESDLMQELGLCLVPLYLEFLRYATKLWATLKDSDSFDIFERNRFRKEAESNFMDLFQNVSILTDSLNHSSRQFIQTPPFRTMAFSIPPKLMAYYTSVSYYLLQALQDDTTNHYGFMIAPSFIQNLEVISLAQQQLTGGDQLLSIAISETSLYTLQMTTFYLAHELSHYLGFSNRMRNMRRQLMMNACIHDFLWTVLDDFMEKLDNLVTNNLDDEKSPHLCLNRTDIWNNMDRLSDSIQSYIFKSEEDRWKETSSDESEPYLQEVSELVREAIKEIACNKKLINEVYFCFWNQLENPTLIYDYFKENVFDNNNDTHNIEPNSTSQHFVYQKCKNLYAEAVKDSCNRYIGNVSGYSSQVEVIADLFRETFADLQAARLLNLLPENYLSIFCTPSKKSPETKETLELPQLHRDRVLAVFSVLSSENSSLEDNEFNSLLSALRGGYTDSLLDSNTVKGVAAYYIHIYLKECLNAIDEAFSNNSKIDELRTLYQNLGNESSVEKLMNTVRETIQIYREELCASVSNFSSNKLT